MSINRDELLSRGDLMGVKYCCHKMSSTRTLPRSVLMEIVGTMSLPKGLDTLLRQEIVDSDVFLPFGRIDSRFREFLESQSVSTILGYIIDPASYADVNRELEIAKQQYAEAVPELLSQYADACKVRDAQIRDEFSNMPWVDNLLRAVARCRPSLEEVERSVYMEGFIYFIGEYSESFDASAEERLQSGVVALRKDLPGMALQEVAKTYSVLAKDLAERKTDYIRQSTVEVASRGADKLMAVAFLDPRIGIAGRQLRAAFQQFRREDALRHGDRDAFIGVVNRLASQRHLIRCLDTGADPTACAGAKTQGTLKLPGSTPAAPAPSVAGPITLAAATAVVSNDPQPAVQAALPESPRIAAPLQRGLFG